MKQKKPPYIVLTIVCLGVAGAFALNVKSRPEDPAEKAREEVAKHKTDEPETPKSIGGATRQKISSTPMDGGPKGAMHGGGGEDNFVTAVAPKMMKPTKSDNSTSSQWYK